MGSQGRRGGLLAIVALIAAGLALPSAGQGAKPTGKFDIDVPAQGRIGFNHFTYKAKKKKDLSKRAAKRLGKGSKKLSKKVRAKVKLKGKKGLDEDVQVAASFARIKGKKRRFALDVAVVHAGPGAQPLGSPARRTAGAAGAGQGLEVLANLFVDPEPGEVSLFVGGQWGRIRDEDVTADDPDRPEACAPDGEFADYAKRLDVVLNGDLIADLKASIAEFGQLMFCDLPIPDHLAPLFDELQLDQPPICSPDLSASEPPAPAREFRVSVFCRVPVSGLAFEVPGQRAIESFTPMQRLPNCQRFTNFQNNNAVLNCQGGTLPRNVFDAVRIRPNTPLNPCDRITIYVFPLNSQPGAQQPVLSTEPFATCP